MSMASNQAVTVEQSVAQAREAKRAGNAAEAERLLRHAVAQRPGYVPALAALGEVLYAKRDFSGAALVLEDAAAAEPENADLKMQAGNALHMAGRPADAIGFFGAVAQANPDHWLAFNNLGSAWQALNQLDKAVDAYGLSLQVSPKQFLANFNLGMLHLTHHKFAEAAPLLARAVAADGQNVTALHHLGVTLLYQQKHAQAETIFKAALRLAPGYFITMRSLGLLLLERGRFGEALELLRSASERNPGDASTVFFVAKAELGLGNTTAGIEKLKAALALDAKLTDARLLLVSQLIAAGDDQQAALVSLAGLAITPHSMPLRLAAANALRYQDVTELKPATRQIVLDLINDGEVCTQDLANTVTSVARHSPFFKPLLDAAIAGTDPLAAEHEAHELMCDNMLLAALPRIVVVDPDMELVLTAFRRSYLLRAVTKGYPLSAPEGANGPFISVLARHFFTAEYAQFVQPDEQQKFANLKAKLETSLIEGDMQPRKLEWSLAIYAMYAPLTTVPGWRILLDVPLNKWSEPLSRVIREQVVDKELEVIIAGQIPELTPVNDATSKAFVKLYDSNPYPRWRSMSVPRQTTIEAEAQQVRGGALPVYPKPTSILVAGCGTGQHPIQTAMRFPNVRVLALDISGVSLGYAARMADQFNVKSIVWRRGDLLELGGISEKFARIECVGVLHHVKDPAAALAVLRDRLLPGGLLKFSVYSKAARRHVEATRQFVKANAFPDTPEGIREARRAILALPKTALEREVATSADFYASSSCRFLAFPVEEHLFTIPELETLLKELRLRFLGFELPSGLAASFRKINPEPSEWANLAAWTRFEAENPGTFDGMYSLWTEPFAS